MATAAELAIDVARLQTTFDAHELRDEDRFADLKEQGAEIKQDIKEMRQENKEQHEKAVLDMTNSLEDLREEVASLKTPAVAVDGYTFTKWQVRIGLFVTVAVSATLGADGIRTSVSLVKELIASVAMLFS